MAQGLDRSDLASDPFEQFDRWLDEAIAAGMHEPVAMVVSTATADAVPSSRHVLLRDRQGGAFSFFTNYDSPKSRELGENPLIAACFPWNVLSRQVRIVGRVERTSAEASDAYFASRPRGSQIGAWGSAQSEVIESRSVLEQQLAEVEARFDGVEVPRPPNWGGFRILPAEFEFWQGRPSRLHDRFRYRPDPDTVGWIIERLSP